MLTTTSASVRERLRTLASLSPQAGEAADAMAGALDDVLRVALTDLLGSLAAELTGQLDHARVEVRLDGRDATLVVVPEPESAPPPPPASGGEARLTVRLPESLKDALTREADREGISVNAWIVRTLGGATNRAPSATIIGSRLTGWARS